VLEGLAANLNPKPLQVKLFEKASPSVEWSSADLRPETRNPEL